MPLLPQPPRLPDLMPCDFFLWGYVKDKVYVSPMLTTLQKLQERITAAVMDVDGNMLVNVWTELDYRLDVCRVTKGAHIEHLKNELELGDCVSFHASPIFVRRILVNKQCFET